MLPLQKIERKGGGMFETERNRMVEYQIAARGVTHKGLLASMRSVPRHLFVPEQNRDLSYEDRPVSIGFAQTISQPYIVALMIELVEPMKTKKLLEVGSGCGYLLAVASALFKEVVGIECVEGLYTQSVATLKAAGITNSQVVYGDGYEGAKDKGPFDAIIVSCACSRPPSPLLAQLSVGGILAAPVGDSIFQELVTVKRMEDGTFMTASHGAVRFVPLVSPHELG
jgi:protein-L-isoaspartate(D-aspartate) O-methyltransferase